jgi:hypothetical protein
MLELEDDEYNRAAVDDDEESSDTEDWLLLEVADDDDVLLELIELLLLDDTDVRLLFDDELMDVVSNTELVEKDELREESLDVLLDDVS